MVTAQTLMEKWIPANIRIGIGTNGTSWKVRESIRGIEDRVTIYTDPELLIDDLYTGKIDAALRGDMSSAVVLPILKRRFGVSELERVVLLEPQGRKMIMTAPVGIDEGWTVDQKYELVIKSIALMEKLGMGKRIAIMSGGREDDVGRHPQVDKTIRDASELVERLNDEGYDAYNTEILIETAVNDADLIIAPDGISGNLIFRTLHFLGGAKALGAPVINIDKVFVDTSRAKTDYKDSIALAIILAEGKK